MTEIAPMDPTTDLSCWVVVVIDQQGLALEVFTTFGQARRAVVDSCRRHRMDLPADLPEDLADAHGGPYLAVADGCQVALLHKRVNDPLD